MPKENRFAGLGDAIDGDDQNENEPVETSTGESEQSSPGNDDQSSPGNDDTSAGAEVDGEVTKSPTEGEVASDDAGESVRDDTLTDKSEPERSGPAFEFEATTAKSIYVRQATLGQLDDAEFEVESLLRKDHDIRNLTGREFHDALVRIATEHPDEIVDAILDTRDE